MEATKVAAHTPGPWRVGMLLRGKYFVGPEGLPHAAQCDDIKDAALIAAAPDLLAVAAEMTDLFQTAVDVAEAHDGRERKQDRAKIAAARAAIAKAQP